MAGQSDRPTHFEEAFMGPFTKCHRCEKPVPIPSHHRDLIERQKLWGLDSRPLYLCDECKEALGSMSGKEFRELLTKVRPLGDHA
jgi:hypothetical protein